MWNGLGVKAGQVERTERFSRRRCSRGQTLYHVPASRRIQAVREETCRRSARLPDKVLPNNLLATSKERSYSLCTTTRRFIAIALITIPYIAPLSPFYLLAIPKRQPHSLGTNSWRFGSSLSSHSQQTQLHTG